MGLIVGTALSAVPLFLCCAWWRLLLLGGRDTCPEGLCVVWAYIGLWGYLPTFAICAVAAGLTARTAARDRRRTDYEVWHVSALSGLLALVVAGSIGVAVIHVYWDGLFGPVDLLSALRRQFP